MTNLLKSRSALFFTLLVLITFFDQITKFKLVALCNSGVAFGFLQTLGFINSIISALTLAILVYFLLRQKRLLPFLALSLVISGGVSNLIDRIIFGCIRDFIQIWSLPTFNLADCTVAIGVVLIFYILIIGRNDSRV